MHPSKQLVKEELTRVADPLDLSEDRATEMMMIRRSWPWNSSADPTRMFIWKEKRAKKLL